jgi:hypothetical protein
MKTSELIEFLSTKDFTNMQAYDLIVADLFEMVSTEEVANAQRLGEYFEYKIKEVLLPTINKLKAAKSL